jgi:hypothetical protein
MNIETLADWKARLEMCGCCEMPVCPEPVMVCESMNLSIVLSGGFQDPDYPPGGDFDLALWQTNKKRTTEYACNLAVDEDTTDGSGGGVHTIGSGSFTAVHVETYDEVWDKGGCSAFSNTVTETYSGDGSFTVEEQVEFACGGVWTKKKLTFTETVFTYVGGDANPSPPPAFYAADTWRRDLTEEVFSYLCDGGVLVDDGSVVTPTTDFWTYPSVITTAAAGVHPDRVITRANIYEEPVSWSDLEAEMLAWITANKAAPCWASTGVCKATKTASPPGSYLTGGSPIISTKPLRFRFRIPDTHLGSKFTITYDIGEFPTDGDPSFVSQDNVVEWTGPGSGASSDPSWLTPWVEIDPPEVPGERRIVNIRFSCYTGTKFGSKPQVMGEALDIPPP